MSALGKQAPRVESIQPYRSHPWPKAPEKDGEVNIDTDVIPLRWNNDGTIVLKCCIDEEGEKEVKKTIDVLSRKK